MKSSYSSACWIMFFKVIENVWIDNDFKFRHGDLVCLSRCKIGNDFELSKSGSCFMRYSIWCTVIQLQKILSSIIVIDDSNTVCKHKSWFDWKSTSCINLGMSSFRTCDFYSRGCKDDLSWVDRHIFTNTQISTDSSWSVLFWKRCIVGNTENYWRHEKKQYLNDTVSILFWYDIAIWFSYSYFLFHQFSRDW